jgi:hypothetical protein
MTLELWEEKLKVSMNREFLATQEMIGIPLTYEGQMFIEPAKVIVKRSTEGEIASIDFKDAKTYRANADGIYEELQLTLGGEFDKCLEVGIDTRDLTRWERLLERIKRRKP